MAHCAHCGTTDNLEQHHVVPRCEGGSSGEIEILCRTCHHNHHWERGDFARWKREGIQALFRDFGEQEARALLRKWGRRGGHVVVAKRGREHMARIGRKGGNTTVARHGRDYMAQLGRKGGKISTSRRNGHDALEVNA